MKLNNVIVNAALSFICVTTVFSTLANTRSETIAVLQSKTQLPVEFPSVLPDSGDYETYLNISADINSYSVSFDYTPDCNGSTACTMGYFAGIGNSRIQPKSYYFENDVHSEHNVYQYITLNNGYHAVFINSCGAYCLAMVTWKINGVVYTVNIKNGTKKKALQIANSVYK